MILCDAGPLVALLDRGHPDHRRCVDSLSGLPAEPLLTTWSCWHEAMDHLGRTAGPSAQAKLWTYLEDGVVYLDDFETDEWPRLKALMRQHAETPLDMADASLIAAAERLGQRRIFTLDRRFRSYKIGQIGFEVVP